MMLRTAFTAAVCTALARGASAQLAAPKAETDGKIHFDGEVLTFKAQDTVFKMPGAELSAASFRTSLDKDNVDVHTEMDVVGQAVNEAIGASTASASSKLADHKSSINTQITSQKNRVASSKDALTAQLGNAEAALLAKLEALDASLSNKIAAAKQQINAQLDNRVNKAAQDVPKKFSAVQSALAASAAKFSKAQAAALVGAKAKAGKFKPQWIGGRTSWGFSNMLKWKAGERRDFEGNMGHFSLQDGEWRILKQGVYRMQYWGIMLGRSRSYGTAQIRVNGKNVMDSAKIPYMGNYWDSMHVDHMLKLKKGDKVALWLNSNWRTSYPTTQGRANAYNRAWFAYEGAWK